MAPPRIAAPPAKKRARSASFEDEEDDEDVEDDEDEDDDEEDEDDDEEDDEIVARDDDELEVGAAVPDEEGAELIAIMAKEAREFVGSEPLKSSCVNGRSLRNRSTLRKPDNTHHEWIRDAFIADEKKELIKELGIWKRTLAVDAAARQVAFPKLTLKMSLDQIREEHDKVRVALGLESSDEEFSESDTPEDEDDDEDENDLEDDDDDDEEDDDDDDEEFN
jgi:hypothetical protein